MSLRDVATAIVFIFVAGVSILMVHTVLTAVQATNTLPEVAIGGTIAAIETLDSTVVFVFVGLMIFSLILAFQVNSHPIFLGLSIIAILLFLVIVPAFSNAYLAIASSSAFSNSANEFSMIFLVIQNLPTISLIWAFVLMIVLYGKLRGGDL